MGISYCGKVYSSISASILSRSLTHMHTHFFTLSLSEHFFLLERVGVMDVFFHESLFEWQWFSSEVFISLNMSHATSRDPFQQIKMCRNPQGSKYIRFFFCSGADHIYVMNDTIRYNHPHEVCIEDIFKLDHQEVVQTILNVCVWYVLNCESVKQSIYVKWVTYEVMLMMTRMLLIY